MDLLGRAGLFSPKFWGNPLGLIAEGHFFKRKASIMP
jgi:hypothetical protein